MTTLESGRTLSHYVLLEKLGTGGMGVVWKAHDLKLDRDVAVKLLPEQCAGDASRKSQFEREAKAIAAIRHPNIVTIHAVEDVDGQCFFSMELLDGSPLTKEIAPGGLAPRRFFELALPIVDAIAAAHERGIIHRDLKPGNVVVCRDGAVKVLDFGLARFAGRPAPLDGMEEAATLTYDGTRFSGTVRYMAPEQLRGEAVDHRADIFSLGVLLFELATGRHPFESATTADSIAAVLKDRPRAAHALNPRLPAGLDEVLDRCLEKDALARMATAAELRSALKRLSEGEDLVLAKEEASVAVLPPLDLSPERDQGYFCDGIAEEITDALSRIGGIRVAARSSSFRFRDGAFDPRDVARQLDVATLLEGSVRKAGNRLRITAQLVDAARGFRVWGESFDREMKDIFEIQKEIAQAVARALRVSLSPQERGALGAAPTRHVQAYDYYLRGRGYYYRYGRRDVEFALQLFSRAIELDPLYAAAFAGLADCWSYIFLNNERSEPVRAQAESAGRRAVELAPESARAQASYAVAMSLGDRREEAETAFETAIRLGPGLFEAWYFYARHAFTSGQLEKAARLYERAARVDPEDYQALLLVAQIHDDLGRHDDARGARTEGIARAEKRLELYPDDVRALYMGANGLVALGETERGLGLAGRALELAPDEPMLLYNLGCIYALAGDASSALDCLERAETHGLTYKSWYEHDSNLDGLRGHPRFRALLDRMS